MRLLLTASNCLCQMRVKACAFTTPTFTTPTRQSALHSAAHPPSLPRPPRTRPSGRGRAASEGPPSRHHQPHTASTKKKPQHRVPPPPPLRLGCNPGTAPDWTSMAITRAVLGASHKGRMRRGAGQSRLALLTVWREREGRKGPGQPSAGKARAPKYGVGGGAREPCGCHQKRTHANRRAAVAAARRVAAALRRQSYGRRPVAWPQERRRAQRRPASGRGRKGREGAQARMVWAWVRVAQGEARRRRSARRRGSLGVVGSRWGHQRRRAVPHPKKSGHEDARAPLRRGPQGGGRGAARRPHGRCPPPAQLAATVTP
jgi:hypothetical protein